MARHTCEECKGVTLLVPGLGICYSCLKDEAIFEKVAKELSQDQRNKLADTLEMQAGYDDHIRKLRATWWPTLNEIGRAILSSKGSSSMEMARA